MKVSSPDILHKTEVGGVALGLEGPEAVAAAYEAMLARVREAAPAAAIEGVLLSPMAGPGVDCILGAKVDPVFGPVVLFGLGGIFTEVLGDVALRHAPVGRAEALAMIESLKGAPLLKGARGAEPVDLEALAEAIVALSRLIAALAGEVTALEINPLRAGPGGVLGLDALIERREG